MLKKILLIVLILFIVSAATLLIWRYTNYLNDPNPYKTFLLPRIEMSVIEITSLTPDKAEINASILIKNQLPFGFTADSFRYEFFINGVEIIRSRYKKTIHLEEGDSSFVHLPITVYPHDIDSVLKVNENQNIDSVMYSMHVHFYTDIIFKKEIDVNINRFLPLFHLPEIKVNDIDVDSLNFKRAYILVHASLTNKNVFDIRLKDYAYEIQIENHEVLKGIIEGLTVLTAKNTTPLTVPLTLSFKELGQTLLGLLKKGGNVNYKLHLTLHIQPDQKMMKNSEVIVESAGTVKSLLNFLNGKPEDEKKK